MTRVITPWGQAQKVGEATIPQRAGDRRFSTVVQLLEAETGERLVRFAYTTDGIVRRGPVTLRERDLAKLWQAIRRAPDLDATLRTGLDEINGATVSRGSEVEGDVTKRRDASR